MASRPHNFDVDREIHGPRHQVKFGNIPGIILQGSYNEGTHRSMISLEETLPKDTTFEDLLAKCKDDVTFIAVFHMKETNNKDGLFCWIGKNPDSKSRMTNKRVTRLYLEMFRDTTEDINDSYIVDADDVAHIRGLFDG